MTGCSMRLPQFFNFGVQFDSSDLCLKIVSPSNFAELSSFPQLKVTTRVHVCWSIMQLQLDNIR
ncbi:hypothetical protein BRADI_1g43502v3 [Brachypodium distachyon]|uniref:Uncharacterized protein n=1 Tax=Brachypodium distachyon TaxID=15368 RepID=A0A0Q3JLP1_BRADI|nr:hypothetical protein BRADI_1g43502v3 [Brachypodium distachyon]